jgi:hypothetical protein
MVAPVTGPFVKSFTLKGTPTSLGFKPDAFTFIRSWSRQRKPYNLPLGYYVDSKKITRSSFSDPTSYRAVSDVHYGFPQSLVDAVYNECYNKFVTQLRDSSETGVTLAEHEQAKEMITARLKQLLSFTRAVKSFRFSDAADVLGIGERNRRQIFDRLKAGKLQRDAKGLGKAWLEFHFGWDPLVKDISQATDVLTSLFPPLRVKARAKKTEKKVTYTSGFYRINTGETWDERWLIGADVLISNPNVWLANRLGLLNPAGLAWELVPFSFVVDWFVNVGNFIQSYSDFFGCTLVRPYRTESRRLVYTHYQAKGPLYTPVNNDPYWIDWASEYCNVGRTPGAIPGPTLRIRPLKALSWQRGLTAASLLVGLLKG